MQLFHRQVSAFPAESSSSDKKLLSRITIQGILLVAAVAITIACYSSRSTGVPVLSGDFGPPAPKIAGAYNGIGGQQSMPVDRGRFRINIDAFNYQRRKHISLESAELRSLATALKLELARNPDGRLSADALEKAEKIEKLARDVKEKMKYNPVLGPI